MSGASAAPVPPPGTPIAVPIAEHSVWERITNWAAENKTLVYTIAGATLVVTSAGVVYYLSNDSVSCCFLPAFAICPPIQTKPD